MAKFRKKPIVIEAFQWFRHMGQVGPVFDSADKGGSECFGISTLEGFMRVSEGDWIITGVKGEHYPCKPDIFEATYESVE